MSRTSKRIGLAALVLALVLAGRGSAVEDEKDKNKPAPTDPKLATDIEELKKDLKGLLKDLKRDMPEIFNRLKALEEAKTSPSAETLNIPLLQGDIKALRKDISDLRSQLDNLQTSYEKLAERVRNQDIRTARSLEPRPAAGNTGTIRLQNRSGVSTTVVIDNRGYVLGPYETRLLENRPLGNFTYEVLADNYGVIQAPVTRTLTPEDVFVIQINPGR